MKVGPILKSKVIQASFQKKGKKGQKNVKKGQFIWKLGQKCTKFENISKKGRWLRAIIARNKLLEQALEGEMIWMHSLMCCRHMSLLTVLGTVDK